MKARKTARQIELDVKAYLGSAPRDGGSPGDLYWPGGGGGGGSRKRKSTEPVVKPHAMTSSRCTKCRQYHTAAEHRRHGEGKKATGGKKATAKTKANKKARTKARTRKSMAKTGTRAAKAAKSTTRRVAAGNPRGGGHATRKLPSPTKGKSYIELAELVDRAARSVGESGRYGENNVFISEVWKAMSRHGIDLSLDQMKALLIELSRIELVNLARADMIDDMNPELVEESEIRNLGATFNFITTADVPRGLARSREAAVHAARAALGAGATSDLDVAVVREAAKRVKSPERFGDRKTFIGALWRQLGGRSGSGMTLPEFKDWLIQQHRARRLVLARADLVAAMDPKLVEEAEARTDGATFHFLVDG